MAVTKIWPIKACADIKIVIEYVKNPDKTTYDIVYRLEVKSERQYTSHEAQTMLDVSEYVMRDTATDEKRLITGLNVDPETARDEMLITKKRYGKEDKILLWHGIQSFEPGEIDPMEAHKIGVELAESLWKDYEVVVSTHIDKDHIHNHFVINSVCAKDGKKIDCKWQDMKRESDRLCEKYGKSIIHNPKYAGLTYGEWKAKNQNRNTWITPYKQDIDEAVLMSHDYGEFIKHMKDRGYTIKDGKYFTIRAPGKKNFVRIDRHLGENYTVQGISERIKYNVLNGKIKVLPETKIKKCHHAPYPKAKLKGFKALYIRYCYMLGVIPKRKNVSPARVNFIYREELMNLDKISYATKVITKYDITSIEDLTNIESKLNNKLRCLVNSRNSILRKQQSDPGYEKDTLLAVKNEISKTKKELSACRDIKSRSGYMMNKVKNEKGEKVWREQEKQR